MLIFFQGNSELLINYATNLIAHPIYTGYLLYSHHINFGGAILSARQNLCVFVLHMRQKMPNFAS